MTGADRSRTITVTWTHLLFPGTHTMPTRVRVTRGGTAAAKCCGKALRSGRRRTSMV